MEFLVLLAFAFGCAVGSFANVCIYRMPRDRSIAWPGSHCPACAAAIRWFDNVPLLSYAVLNGRCRACRARISLRYPLVEALTGAIFAFAMWRRLEEPAAYPAPVLGILLASAAALVVSTFIDFDFRILPDEITVGGALLAVPVALLVPAQHVQAWPAWPLLETASRGAAAWSAAAGMAIGAGTIYFMHGLGVAFLTLKGALVARPTLRDVLGRSGLTRWLVTGPCDPKRDAVVGMGDLKLMAAVGGLFGWQAAVAVALLLAPVLGSLFGILSAAITGDRYIAYGPFLAAATLVFMFLRRELLGGSLSHAFV